jgi:hypothetical protein
LLSELKQVEVRLKEGGISDERSGEAERRGEIDDQSQGMSVEIGVRLVLDK